MFLMFPIFHMPTILASQTMGIFYFETFKSLRLTNIVLCPKEDSKRLWTSTFQSHSWSIYRPLAKTKPKGHIRNTTVYEGKVTQLKILWYVQNQRRDREGEYRRLLAA
jgi:hypothetical protein